MPLAFLAADIQAAILEGRQPVGLIRQRLIAGEIPAAWADLHGLTSNQLGLPMATRMVRDAWSQRCGRHKLFATMVALWHCGGMKALDQALTSGRANQKARTRSAILASAAQLIREGVRPTVEEAALAVGISKRTAYRYFASQEHLLADAVLDSLRQRMDELLAPSAVSDDVRQRVTDLAVAMNHLAETHEAELRVMIRTALDRKSGVEKDPGMRPSGQRRLQWIETALRPIQDELPKARYIRLVNSLAVCLGVDALLVLRDVCGISGPEAEETMVGMALTILDKALAESAGRSR